jgi:hypothetical protein
MESKGWRFNDEGWWVRDDGGVVLKNIALDYNREVGWDPKSEHMILEHWTAPLMVNRPGKSDRCSSDPEMGLLDVPRFRSHNSINKLNFMRRKG